MAALQTDEAPAPAGEPAKTRWMNDRKKLMFEVGEESSPGSSERTSRKSGFRLSLAPFKGVLSGRSSRTGKKMSDLVNDMLSDEVLATERALRMKQKALQWEARTKGPDPELSPEHKPKPAKVAAPTAEVEAAVPASPAKHVVAEWKKGFAPPYRPEELTGREWHDGVLPLFVNIFRAVSNRGLSSLPPDDAYLALLRQLLKAEQRDLLAQSKDETADDFTKRRAAQRACQQLILPRASVEGVVYFRKRMSMMAALARSLGAANVPLVVPQQPSETGLQIEKRLEGQAGCAAPLLPWGKHESSANFEARAEAVRRIPRAGHKGGAPPLIIPKGRAESEVSFAARLSAAAVCLIILPQSRDESDELFKKRLHVQIMDEGLMAHAPHNAQIESAEQFEERLSLALPSEEAISRRSTARSKSSSWWSSRISRQSRSQSGQSSDSSERPSRASQVVSFIVGGGGSSPAARKSRKKKGPALSTIQSTGDLDKAQAEASRQQMIDDGAVFRPQTVVGVPDGENKGAGCCRMM